MSTRFDWATHELKHAGWKYYKCIRCGREIGNPSMFHLHENGKDTMSTCPGGTDMSKEELKKYRKDSKKDWESDHACIIGDKKTLEEIAPKNEKPIFTCRFCQQSFTRKLEWAVHELRHTGWKEHKCVKCGKEGGSASFSQHVRRQIESDNCLGGDGLTKEELAIYYKESKKDWKYEHTRIIGSLTTFNENDFKQPIPNFKCCFCSQEFKTRSMCSIHELRHTGWNQCRCIKCGKECSSASVFSDHVYQRKGHKTCRGGVGLSQTELDVYRKQCTKDWASEHARIIGGMTQQEKDDIIMKIESSPSVIHQKTKPVIRHKTLNKLSKPVYTCSFCDMKFGSKFIWACHELEHKGWKYYQCVKCGREFSRNCGGTFSDHINQKHKKQTCPGGTGMNPKDFEAFRNLCKKDWWAEHERIICKKENSMGINDIVQKDSQVTSNGSDSTLVMKNCRVVLTQLNNVLKDSRVENKSSDLKVAASNTCQRKSIVKNCSVVLTRLNIITLMPDYET